MDKLKLINLKSLVTGGDCTSSYR